MRDILSTKWGRLVSFFLLYLTEGIPLGLTGTAIAFEMRKRGMDVAQIGVFVATLYFPWGWKFLVGPVVDLVHSDRLGRRRGWILICQIIMAGTLLIAMPVDFQTWFKMFTAIIVVHNVFAATQDVAIDALAVGTFTDRERGLANGMMFAGAYVGNGLGSAGILYLAPKIGFNYSFVFTAAVILLVALTVTLRLHEPRHVTAQRAGWGDVGRELWVYLRSLIGVMFGTRQAILVFIFALLPSGAYAITLVVRPALFGELGFAENQIAVFTLCGMACSATGCVIGGHLSDKLGRRLMLGIYILLIAVPVIWFAWWMQRHGWIFPVDTKAATKPVPPRALVIGFWIAILSFLFVNGLMYGARTALFMDLCDPALAATQFTVYMSLLNLGMSYVAALAGVAIKRWGYPTTLVLDAAFGCLCILLMPFLKPAAKVNQV